MIPKLDRLFFLTTIEQEKFYRLYVTIQVSLDYNLIIFYLHILTIYLLGEEHKEGLCN